MIIYVYIHIYICIYDQCINMLLYACMHGRTQTCTYARALCMYVHVYVLVYVFSVMCCAVI